MEVHQDSVDRIVSQLVARGEEILRGPAQVYAFTRNTEANLLLNDLEGRPHAFVIACLMDRQMNAERCWLVPHLFSARVGGFEFEQLAALSVEKVRLHMREPDPLHRFVDTMSVNLHSAIQRIASQYGGNAARIWQGKPSSATVVHRFLEFDGMGPKLATMATNILARQFKVPFSDYYSVDLSVDVHIRRVLGRLGVIQAGEATESVIYRARSLHPTFPGLLDQPLWEIGRQWCHAGRPNCDPCSMRDFCSLAAARTRRRIGGGAINPADFGHQSGRV